MQTTQQAKGTNNVLQTSHVRHWTLQQNHSWLQSPGIRVNTQYTSTPPKVLLVALLHKLYASGPEIFEERKQWQQWFQWLILKHNLQAFLASDNSGPCLICFYPGWFSSRTNESIKSSCVCPFTKGDGTENVHVDLFCLTKKRSFFPTVFGLSLLFFFLQAWDFSDIRFKSVYRECVKAYKCCYCGVMKRRPSDGVQLYEKVTFRWI